MQLVLAVLAVLVMTSCGGTSPTAPTATGKTIVLPFSVTSSATSLIVGETATVRVNLGTSTAFTPSWDSDDPFILRVTAEGLVTSVGYGTGVITALHPDGSDASITIYVFPNVINNWKLSIFNFSCRLAVTGPVSWRQCPDDDDIILSYTSLFINGQTPSTDSVSGLPTMSLTGFYSTNDDGFLNQAGDDYDPIEATLHTSGLVYWSTSTSKPYTLQTATGTGTRTKTREGSFVIEETDYVADHPFPTTQIGIFYDVLIRYRGFSDSSIDATYEYNWGGSGWGLGYDREFAHVTPLPFEQLEVPTRRLDGHGMQSMQ